MISDPERQQRTLSSLAASALDAIVCSSPTEVLLVTGYWPVMGASLAVATADGHVTVILPEDETEIADKTTGADLVPYKAAGLKTLQTPIELIKESIASTLKNLSLGRARIGLQLSQGMQPSSYAVTTEYRASLLELLRQLQPDARYESCDWLLETMKAAKTQRELERMQAGVRVAAEGFAAAANCLQPGMRETELAAAAQEAFETTREAEPLQRSYGYFFCMSGPNSAKASASFARTRQRVIAEGDLVMIHANTCADGYWTDLTRTFVAGEPSERQRDLRAAICEARAAGLAAIHPGATGSEVDHASRSVMESRGLGENFKHAAGHGVGFAAANPNGRPRIHPLSPDVLEQGMSFNLEPAAYFDGYGGMRHCDVVAVTHDGVHVLSEF